MFFSFFVFVLTFSVLRSNSPIRVVGELLIAVRTVAVGQGGFFSADTNLKKLHTDANIHNGATVVLIKFRHFTM